MQTLRQPVFLICVFLFVVNQGLERAHIHIPFLFSYLDDLLVMPIVLTLALAAERAYFRDSHFVLPGTYVAGAVGAFSIFFELLLPPFFPKHTADWLDIVAYTLGAILFQLMLNKPTLPKNSRF